MNTLSNLQFRSRVLAERCNFGQKGDGGRSAELQPWDGPVRNSAITLRSEHDSAFTLLELLTVIAIIGILAAIIVPNLGGFKPNVTAAATRQLLDDVARARQLAIANHTTVYMVFVPTNFWTDPAYPVTNINFDPGQRLFDKQLTSYTFVSTRSIGDQPGRPTARYLSPWRTLPEGTYIPPQKFLDPQLPNTFLRIYTNLLGNSPVLGYAIPPFKRTVTNAVPFPSAQSPIAFGRKSKGCYLPYIAFDYMGRLTPEMSDYEYIPLAKGSVLYQRNSTNGLGTPNLPAVAELPPGNITNAFTLIRVDKLTGRPHALHQEVR
jgi:prepilin-type N-terminal cleavage/methylation domain-containing protein